MTRESARELDRHCVIRWLYEAFISPSRAFNEYTDDEIKTLAHDALVLFKEDQEEIENLKQTAQNMMEGIVVMHA